MKKGMAGLVGLLAAASVAHAGDKGREFSIYRDFLNDNYRGFSAGVSNQARDFYVKFGFSTKKNGTEYDGPISETTVSDLTVGDNPTKTVKTRLVNLNPYMATVLWDKSWFDEEAVIQVLGGAGFFLGIESKSTTYSGDNLQGLDNPIPDFDINASLTIDAYGTARLAYGKIRVGVKYVLPDELYGIASLGFSF